MIRLAIFYFAVRIYLYRGKIMVKINKILLIAVMLVCLGSGVALAHFEAYISGSINNMPQQKKTIVVPRGYIMRQSDKIYTPDRYHCYMKRELKYCTTRKGRPLNGIIVNSYDGGLAYEMYQNGYQNGETSLYTQDGTLISRSNYKQGLKHGETTVYYYNGRIEFIIHYKNGALDGRVEQYDINGALVGKMTYKKGWFREGYCKNEAKGSLMRDRLSAKRYNEIIPCGTEYEN